MKQVKLVGPQFIVTHASFIAPHAKGEIKANDRIQLSGVVQDQEGKIHGGYANGGRPFHLLSFEEEIVFRVDQQYDNHAMLKRRARYRHMMIHAFKKHFKSYGWQDTKKSAFGFSNRRNPRYQDNNYIPHSLAEYARMMADPYFKYDGSLHEDYLYIPEHEITQAYFDDLAWEDISNWN